MIFANRAAHPIGYTFACVKVIIHDPVLTRCTSLPAFIRRGDDRMLGGKDELPVVRQGTVDIGKKYINILDVMQHQARDHKVKGSSRIIPIFEGVEDNFALG